MRSAPHASPRFVEFSVVATLGLIFLILLVLRGPSGLYGEQGPVEIASVVGYLGAALAFMLAARDLAAGPFWHVPMTLIFATGRELDLDKSLLSGGILKSRFYTGDFPLWEKMIGLAIVIFALWTGYRLLRHGTGPVWRAIRAGKVWPWLVTGSLLVIIVAKSVDGLGRKLHPFGIELSQTMNDGLAKSEEWLELGVSIALLLAVALWARDRTPTA